MSGFGNVVGAFVGAAIGFFVPGIGTALGWAVGGLLGGLLFPPKGPDGPRLEDLRPQSSEYGRPIPLVYGTFALGGNVIWASDLIEVEGDSGGGKGGSEATTYSYFANFAVAICEGSDNLTLGRIWAGPEKRLIWDGATLEGADSGASITFYSGSETQLPDPLIESYEGAGNVPAYRGTCYLVVEYFPVAKDGNRIPFLTIEVGNVAAATSLGQSYVIQVILSDDRLYYFYQGSFEGVIIRSLSADYPLVGHYQFADNWPVTGSPFFIAEDLDKMVVATGNLSFFVIDTLTGSRTQYSLVEPVGADADMPETVFGGAYLNGKYIIATRDGVQRVGLWIIDPSDPSVCEAAYAADTGAGQAQTLRAPPGATGTYLYVMTTTKVMRHAIASATPPTDLGAAAGGTDGIEVDPDNGTIWTVYLDGSKNLHVTVHSPTTGQLASHVIASSFQFLAVEPITFTPDNKVTISGKRYLAADHFVQFDRLAPYSYSGEIVGGYTGTAEIHALVWNPVQTELLAIRKAGIVSPGDTASYDPLTANYLVPGTYVAEADNWNLNDSDVTPQGQALSEIVSDLSARAGLTAGQIDVTALTDIVDGYAVTQQTAVREAITALMPAYFFDAVESDGKVEFVKRGGAIAVVIPDDDVGSFVAGTDPPEPLETTRAMENELPRTLNVKYILAATNYSVATRSAKRLVGASGEERTLDFPIVMTDTKAQEVTEVNLHGAWVARLSYSFTLPRKYGYLEPTDIVVVYGHTMRLTKTVSAGGVIRCEAKHDDSNVYVPNVVVTETPPDDQTVDTTSESILELMDINMLQDGDDDPGFYAAACAADQTAVWPGAVLYRSTDGGASYSSLVNLTAEATMGYTTDALGNFFAGNIPDELNSVNVVLSNGSLSSTTFDGMLSGVNTCVIGDEILHFRTATLEANGSYTLTGLLRGRRGTEYAMGDHAAGDRFVLFNSAVVRVPQVTADVGPTRQYKGVTVGSTLAATTPQSLANAATGLKPYACTHLGGGRNAAGDITLNWSRRSRVDGAWRDSVDIPLGESSEAYEVEIYSDGTYTTVERTITGLTSPTTPYTAAQQTTDFGSPQATVYFRVYQMSATVGRGHAASGSV